MISNRDLIDKTKPVLKDSYLQIFACLLLASLLPQIVLSLSPTNVLLNIVVVCVSAYIQVGIALYCLEIYKGKMLVWKQFSVDLMALNPLFLCLYTPLLFFLA